MCVCVCLLLWGRQRAFMPPKAALSAAKTTKIEMGKGLGEGVGKKEAKSTKSVKRRRRQRQRLRPRAPATTINWQSVH